jgi:hypothetical protein
VRRAKSSTTPAGWSKIDQATSSDNSVFVQHTLCGFVGPQPKAQLPAHLPMYRKNQTLEELTARLITCHQRFESAAKRSLIYAKRAGAILLRIKDRMKHGEYLPFIESKLPFSIRTAQVYTRVAKKWWRVKKALSIEPHLDLDQVIRLLRLPKEPTADAPDPEATDHELAQERRRMLRLAATQNFNEWSDQEVLAFNCWDLDRLLQQARRELTHHANDLLLRDRPARRQPGRRSAQCNPNAELQQLGQPRHCNTATLLETVGAT